MYVFCSIFFLLQDNDNDEQFLKVIERNLLNKVAVRGIAGVRKVYIRKAAKTYFDASTGQLVQSKEDENESDERKMEFCLDTDGVSLLEVMNRPEVDFRRTTSNHIVDIFHVLGIEACRQSLLQELRNVISFDGAYVNYRHLAMMVDTMTYRGHLMAISRHGINRIGTGPLMRCSFEETVEILVEAAAHGLTDNLNGVSENVMLGNLAPLGTGAFQLRLDEQLLLEKAKDMDSHSFHYTEYQPYQNGAGSQTPLYNNNASPIIHGGNNSVFSYEYFGIIF